MLKPLSNFEKRLIVKAKQRFGHEMTKEAVRISNRERDAIEKFKTIAKQLTRS